LLLLALLLFLKAQERAKQALKQLQKEKQERLVALQEQRQLRQVLKKKNVLQVQKYLLH